MAELPTDSGMPGSGIAYLNQGFYSTSPSVYFTERLNSLLVTAAGHGEYGPLLRAGVRVGPDGFTVDDDELVRSSLSDDDLKSFVIADSLVILCHASEALLRMFLGHDGQPPCPWVEVAKLRAGKQFWGSVERSILERPTADLHRAVSDVMLGSAEFRPEFGLSEEAWGEAVSRLSVWLTYLARRLREDVPAYNSAKHGFGVRASETQIGIYSNDPGGPSLSYTGPSVDVLEHGLWVDDIRPWSLVTYWQNPVAMWLFSSTAIRLIENIWQVGRSRYTGHASYDVFASPHLPSDVLEAHPPVAPRRFSRPAVVERRDISRSPDR